MKTEKLIAGALVAFSAVAAVGSWFSAQPDTPVAHREDRQPLGFLSKGGSGEIAVIDIQGMITDAESGGFGGTGTSAQGVLEAIAEIREDEAPVVVLNINSPGGTASASQAIYDELMRLKKEKGVKVVAAMGDLAASGGYYVACAADTIVANPATLTGSIGVIMHTQNLQGLMGKLGVVNGTIQSGPHKDIGSPFKPLAPAERRILQGIVDDTYQQFIEAVAAGRKLPVSAVRPLADGRIFTGRQAKAARLVDTLGNYTVALAEARRLAGLSEDAETQNYTEEDWRNFFQLLTSRVSDPLGAVLGARASALSANWDRIPLMIYE